MTMDQIRNKDLIKKLVEEREGLQKLLEQTERELNTTHNSTAKEAINLEKEIITSQIEDVQKREIELNQERLRMQNQKLNDIAMLHVYYKQVGIMEYAREEIYSNVDFLGREGKDIGLPVHITVVYYTVSFLAAVGGLIGLCTGFSILSLMEVLYWFTYRMFNDYTRKLSRVQT